MKALTLFLFAVISFPVWAAVPAGQVIFAVGSVQAIAPDKTTRPLQRGTPFYQSDILQTGGKAQAKLRFSDGTLMTLNSNTRIRVDSYRYEAGEAASNNSYIVTLATGGFRTVSGAIAQQDTKAYQVRTPVATIAIRGTDYSVIFNTTQGLITSVWQGVIALTNDRGTIVVGEGQDFRAAQIKAAYAMPEGLTNMPKVLTNNPVIGQQQQQLSSPNTGGTTGTTAPTGSGKGPLLEICVP